MRPASLLVSIALVLIGSAHVLAEPLPREEWGAMPVTVSNDGPMWTIAGKKQTVVLNSNDLSFTVDRWSMEPSKPGDLIVKSNGVEIPLRLADAEKIDVARFDPAFQTGVKIKLSGWKHEGARLNLTLWLTLALEGKAVDLSFTVAADERNGVVVRRLDWPGALDARDVDYTLLSNWRGVMLPRHWPKPYFPIRATNPDGSAKESDTSEVQSNVIESWSMPWWGFQRGDSAMMVLIETPDDAAYQFDHPAGGPTVIGPRCRASLGKLAYPRGGRMCFFERGNYVDMAKRYRQHAIDRGLFVSLRQKIADRPVVKELIATPLVRMGILTNIKSDSLKFSTTQPETNHRLTTFDQRAEQLRKWKQNGIERLHVCLTGWPREGYDRQHPDELPPAPVAGGWEGMKRLGDTCSELGYLFSLHDQYRDFYRDAPSFNPQFAVQEEDAIAPSNAFPGTRFGQWKKDGIPFMNNWDGGTMAYLNNRFMLGHLVKNYTALLARGVHPQGVYLDVFGYVPPDEDFNPEHPTTRRDAINARVDCYHWAKANIGFIGTEAACDWTVPYSDFSSPLKIRDGVGVPLFNLVYHDAIITPYAPGDLNGFLNGGLPQMSGRAEPSAEELKNVKRMAALHKRVALLEMTRHEFLDEKFRRERTTFADGTTVTVDWDAKKVEIVPDVE